MKKLLYISCILWIFTSCSSDLESGLSFDSNDSFEEGEANPDQAQVILENPFVKVNEEPTSTFSVDADGASYAFTRRSIMENNSKPPQAAIRTEEFLNYFDLDYAFEDTGHPISLNGEVASCPWHEGNKLVRIGIEGAPMPAGQLPNSNYVLLIDVSGSMDDSDRLPMLKDGFIQLLDEMQDDDRVAIVTYAGRSRIELKSTKVEKKSKIICAIEDLKAGGSTAGSAGIIEAYELAESNFIEGGNNRIIVGTDGNFNVGISDQESLLDLIEEKREKGVFLTVLGVGNNVNDGNLEQIANHGNGNYEYIDNQTQLKKVFVHDYHKYFTVAKDVKVQVSFNPNMVEAYRLIGYENRILSNEDFEDDTKDAGEIGADQNISALYEIIPTGLKGEPNFNIEFRYKQPDEDNSQLLNLEVFDLGTSFENSSDAMKFVSSVASFGLVLSNSSYKGIANYDLILEWLSTQDLEDKHGFKDEFISIVEKAKTL